LSTKHYGKFALKNDFSIIYHTVPSDLEICKQVRLRNYHGFLAMSNAVQEPYFAWMIKMHDIEPDMLLGCWTEAQAILIDRIRKHQFKPTNSLSAYLKGICNNLVMRHFRARGKEVSFASMDSIPEEYQVDIEKSHGTEQDIAARAILELSLTERNLIVARFYEGMSIPEIQKQFGFKNENTTSVSIHRAKQLIT